MFALQVKTGSGASVAAESRRKTAERREFRRIQMRFQASVQVDGRKLCVDGLDAHRAGARVVSGQPLPEGALVLFHMDSSGFAAYASVRRCEKAGRGYEIGLEFLVPRNPSE
ncbi:MAG: hypothetical protein C5B51_23580 [Terriglobia bacterium]|nr:MAG: hypothetical protein C5B51_23580 [Terriglobia bacterium]